MSAWISRAFLFCLKVAVSFRFDEYVCHEYYCGSVFFSKVTLITFHLVWHFTSLSFLASILHLYHTIFLHSYLHLISFSLSWWDFIIVTIGNLYQLMFLLLFFTSIWIDQTFKIMKRKSTRKSLIFKTLCNNKVNQWL